MIQSGEPMEDLNVREQWRGLSIASSAYCGDLPYLINSHHG